MIGKQVLHYHIETQLGAGGIGEDPLVRTSTKKHKDTEAERRAAKFLVRAFLPLCLCVSVFFISFESSQRLARAAGAASLYGYPGGPFK